MPASKAFMDQISIDTVNETGLQEEVQFLSKANLFLLILSFNTCSRKNGNL